MPSTCPNVLSTGTCTDPSCRHEHNLLVCEICSYLARNKHEYDAHMRSRRHKNRVTGRGILFHCSVCNKNVASSFWQQHINGGKHARRAMGKQISPVVDPQEGVSTASEKYCTVCKVLILNNLWNGHLQSQKHRRREKFSAYRAALDEAEKDKNGIIAEGDLDFDIVEPGPTHASVKCRLTLKTTTPNLRVRLISHKLVSSRSTIDAAFIVVQEGNNRDISPRASVTLTVTLNQTNIGRYKDRLEVTLEDVTLKKQFLISRPVEAIIGNKADYENLRASAPYVPRPRRARLPEQILLEGERPPALRAIPYIVRLPKADIPAPLLQVITEGNTKDIVNQIKKTHLPARLDSNSFARHFRTLLWIEEHKTEQDLERYDIPSAKLNKHGSYFFIEVPGLAEKRPSVLLGDRILVQTHGSDETKWYEGYVHIVRKEEVGLKFNRLFEWNASQSYRVRFKLNRITLRRQHHALDMVFQEDRVLFPTVEQASSVPRASGRLRFHNTDIESNVQQSLAVISIVKRPPGSPTFVIFGPFGTGKTSTLIEAMLQVLNSNPQAKILACAPSNSAADLLTTKLGAVLNNEQLFRFNAPSRDKKSVPDKVLEYSYLKELAEGDNHGEFSHLPLWERPARVHFGVPTARVKHFRVIVSTCISASFAADIGMPRGHFSHIFIDEAGQATEPESLVSVKKLADPSTNIILAGDPKQLGPVVRSPIARDLGLQKSYLERMMERDAYNIEQFSGATVVKLINNYRSHPAIMRFPNEQFYGGELQAKARPAKTNKYLNWPLLPNKKFPIIFHAVYGKDERESNSPSFFNIEEVLQIKDYVQKLRADRGHLTTEADIGIIAPYYAQCLKMRTALRGVADGIKVGSVEEFQGQERPVIMISTVRSSKEFVEFDIRHTLGFVANPRRFNVAVTRTQALLIIVGDPQILSLDPLWRSFLNYIYNHGGWKGPRPDWDTNAEVNMEGGYDRTVRERAELDMNEFVCRIEAMTLDEAEDDDAAVVEQPWRDLE